MKLEITAEDIINANMNMVYSFVIEAHSTLNNEKKKKNLYMAKNAIEKTLKLLEHV